MKSISPIRLCVALIALIFTQQAYCAGSSVANKSVKIFKELIVEGERPEISSCLTAAIQSVKVNPVYSKINWEPKSLKDFGTFTCKASNEIGSNQCKIEIQLGGKAFYL